ncbi:MAG: CvpA family protein [Desulfobacterales bacterium]
MNLFDMVCIIILGYCLVRGIFRGLIKELSSIVGVFGGFYAAYTYYIKVGKLFSSWISNTSYLNILSFLIIFCGVFIIISIIGVIIKYLLNIAFLGWVDHIFGAGFGAIKGILIVSMLLMILTAFLPKNTPLIKNSLLSPIIASVSGKMSKVVSKDMKREFVAKIEEYKKAWKIR